jgi:SH3-like domain-containing protein
MSGIFAGWLGTRLYGDSGNSEAIVIVGEVMARSGPDKGQTEVFTAHEGTKVRLVRQEDEWILVRLANGLGGWIQTEAVARI